MRYRPILLLVGLLRRYSKKDDLTSTAVRLAKLLEVEREPVPEPEPFHVRRVEWRLGKDGIKELVVDYEAGLGVPELQAKYGLSKGSVRKLLSEARELTIDPNKDYQPQKPKNPDPLRGSGSC